MSEHNEMGDITDSDEGTNREPLSDMRRVANHNDEGSKKGLPPDTKRVANLVSVLGIAAAIGGFGYVAYGGDRREVGLRGIRLGTIYASVVWLFS